MSQIDPDEKQDATQNTTLEQVEHVEDQTEFTPAEERKLLRKLDPILLGFAMLLYLCAYLDRGNLGNARLMGLEKDALDNSDTKYATALSLFYVTYICLAIPGTLMSKYFLPSTALGFGCTLWAIAATAMAATRNPAGVYICRMLLGAGEASFGQAVALTCSFWYTKSELAARIGIFISAGSLAGAFGGLIAFGVSSIQNPLIEQWRCLFLIEGLPGLLLGVLVFLFLPTHPEQWKYLTPRQRAIAVARKASDSTNEGHTGVDKEGVKRAFRDWKTYVMALMYTCMNTNLSSIGGFLPTIVKGLGYTDAKAQLFTVPPYAVALVVTVLSSYISDKTRSRGIPVALNYAIGVVGWVILLVMDAGSKDPRILHVRYFGVICVVAPAYATIPLQMSWAAALNPSQSQRAVAMGMLNTIGQFGAIVGANIFPSKDKPQYHTGVIVNISMQCLGAAIAIGMTSYLRYNNRQRDRVEGKSGLNERGLNVKTEYDLAKGFRYMV